MTTLATIGLAVLLAVGTAAGVAHAVSHPAHNRLAPATSAPVYGSR